MNDAPKYLHLLPSVFQGAARPGSPLCATLDAMQALLDPAEKQIEQFPDVLDPRRTPERFVFMLATWLDLDRLLPHRGGKKYMPTGLGRLRELIANAHELTRLRGTSRGLCKFLHIATGIDGFEVQEKVVGQDGRILPFHIRVEGPAEAERHRAFIERIIDAEKPAHLISEFSIRRTQDRELQP